MTGRSQGCMGRTRLASGENAAAYDRLISTQVVLQVAAPPVSPALGKILAIVREADGRVQVRAVGERLGLDASVRGRLEPLRAKMTELADRGWLHKRPDGRFTARPQPGGAGCLQSSSDKTRPIPSLDVFRYRNMIAAMARAATTSDAFNAIAEPQRRDILALLRAGERPVTDLAEELGMSQPRASKHLRVLREVGLVRVRGAGKQRLYGLDARGLRPVHEWVGGFERFWNGSFDRLDTYVQDLKQTRQEE